MSWWGTAKIRDEKRRWCAIKNFRKGKWLKKVRDAECGIFPLCSKNEMLRASGSPREIGMTIPGHNSYSVHGFQYGQFRCSPAWTKFLSLR